jgi:hypothetical protein
MSARRRTDVEELVEEISRLERSIRDTPVGPCVQPADLINTELLELMVQEYAALGELRRRLTPGIENRSS